MSDTFCCVQQGLSPIKIVILVVYLWPQSVHLLLKVLAVCSQEGSEGFQTLLKESTLQHCCCIKGPCEVVYAIKKVRRFPDGTLDNKVGVDYGIKAKGATENYISQLFPCPQCSKAGILERK